MRVFRRRYDAPDIAHRLLDNMTDQLTRRDFANRMAAFGLALGLTPAATLAQTKGASPSETLPAITDLYSLVDPQLLPTLKQFPAFDVSAELVRQFRQMPGMPALPAPAPQPVERRIPGPKGAPEVRLWIVRHSLPQVRNRTRRRQRDI